MRLRVMFVKYPGHDLMPNAICVVDNYMEDEHGGVPDYFTEEVAKFTASAGDDATIRFAFIHVPDQEVESLFATTTLLASGVFPVPDP